MAAEGRTIGLAEAAQRLGVSWARAYNFLLSQTINGVRGPNGRWQVFIDAAFLALERDIRRKRSGLAASATR